MMLKKKHIYLKMIQIRGRHEACFQGCDVTLGRRKADWLPTDGPVASTYPCKTVIAGPHNNNNRHENILDNEQYKT